MSQLIRANLKVTFSTSLTSNLSAIPSNFSLPGESPHLNPSPDLTAGQVSINDMISRAFNQQFLIAFCTKNAEPQELHDCIITGNEAYTKKQFSTAFAKLKLERRTCVRRQ